jgi:unsaturated chondroitin disaccharide hydrolase
MQYRKNLLLLACLFIILVQTTQAQQKKSFQPNKHLAGQIIKNLAEAAEQYKILMKNLPADKFPKTYFPLTGKYEFSNSGWWCSGFYPSTLLYLSQATQDSSLNKEALRIMDVLKQEQFNTRTHDLGFMMYCPFGNLYKKDPQPAYRDILLNSAKSLSTRFSEKTGCIKSWDSKEGDFLVIIDNMMNLELLFWATKITGDSSFYKIAVTHANTTIKNHFRPDYSSYHVINYDPVTGVVKEKKTAQGAANESAWARGQAWGLYGYTAAYRETKDPAYLSQANHIASFLLSNPNLPADKIPYWDFNAPGIPNVYRDASAAAIMAAALLELQAYTDAPSRKKYIQVAEKILTTLSDTTYKAAVGTNGGFILKHGVGHLPGKTEVDVPLTYGDYYFIEAMLRYQRL